MALGRQKPSNVNWGNQLTDDDLVVEVRKAIADNTDERVT
jgi:hypothetical protein